MRKLLLVLVAFFLGMSGFFAIPAYADDSVADESAAVRKFFDGYVSAGNTFSDNYWSYFAPNATITRVVIKKDGSTQTVNVPMDRYKKETNSGKKYGKVVKYKNTYSDIKINKSGDDYVLTAIRMPSPGGRFPAKFIIGKDSSGNFKIKEESMNTDVQKFLKN